jgi:two-component system sensor histidine kinase PhoQ
VINHSRPSLTQRLLLAISLVLFAFLGISAFSLDNAFETSAEQAQKTRLKNYVYTILTAAELRDDGELNISRDLAEPRFSTPNSGLYAQITSGDKIVWQSPSALGLTMALPYHPGASVEHYSIYSPEKNLQLYNLAFGIVWENEQGKQFHYTINVSENLAILQQQTASFQRSLWYWLGGTGLVLLIAQWLILRWGMRPLYDVSKDLHAIENGEHSRLSDNYPTELKELTQNINQLLDHEQSRRERYKNSLADLAHSLKTPLSVFRGELDKHDEPEALKQVAYEQLDRVTALVDYQLQRASTQGKGNLSAPVSLATITEKVINSLDKVYQAKQIHTECEISANANIHADEGDMYELLGNLLENAYKYGEKRVKVTISCVLDDILITIEDDGFGIPTSAQREVIKRGHRMDSQVEGHGLGLAIVSDIVNAYAGSMDLTQSDLGGACFQLRLPRH